MLRTIDLEVMRPTGQGGCGYRGEWGGHATPQVRPQMCAILATCINGKDTVVTSAKQATASLEGQARAGGDSGRNRQRRRSGSDVCRSP